MGIFRTGRRAVALKSILAALAWSALAWSALAWSALAGTAAAAAPEIRTLDSTVTDATVAEVTSGSLDSRFTNPSFREAAARGETFWLRIKNEGPLRNDVIPILVAHAGMLHRIRAFSAGSVAIPPAAHIPEFAGARDIAFVLPNGDGTIYVRVEPPGAGYGIPRFSVSTLDRFLSEGASRARMITLAFGALAAMAVAALLIWIVLAERA